ncbi:S1C family serine protease [Bacillus benzoevorans]|uniref:Serine protease Do n=1 Tax=Bacillus benzoevorans TaxID=1456 RepID=A0A7X0HPK7_9BACI|nr:trypsin-like peptidase domain-containing protein [Bacillus benzoevorans]MBB6444623.1 serine protease Do [Bacillus benzoevorans]
MSDLNEQIITPEEVKRPRRPKPPWVNSLMTAVAGGLVGSMLTITVLPHVDYFTGQVTSQITESGHHGNGPGAVTVQKTAASSDSDSVADMVEKASKAIVGIVNMQTQTQWRNFPDSAAKRDSETVESGSGTGVIFKIDGSNAFIVTNNHVIEGAKELEITVAGGEKTKAELIGADPLSDLAVLKIDAKYAASALDFGDSRSLRAGDPVLAIGNPLGLDLSNTVTRGIVSAVDRTVPVSTSAGKWDLNVIQTDAAINPGNSGGALMNTSGQVMGINSLKIAEDNVEGLGFAIPSNDVVAIINEIMEKGHVERPYIGVGLANLEEVSQRYLQDLPLNVEGGAIVTSVDPTSAAVKAGLEVQDIITAINGQKINSSDDLRKYLYTELKAGDKVTLDIYRGSKQMKVELTLTSTGNTIE